MNIEFARKNLPLKLANVQEVAKDVLRGIRRSGQQDIAVYFFDFSGRIRDIAADLDGYQDNLLGGTYFDSGAAPDLRWNHYLYMVGGEEVTTKELSEPIRKIQSDQSYARKFVIANSQLESVISQINHIPTTATGNVGNVLEVWTQTLSSAGLDCVLDVEKTLKDTARIIATGKSKNTTRVRKISGEDDAQKLSKSWIRELELSGYRTIPARKRFTKLGRANLIFGTNGVGKTSLLEAIELLYCGNNRRSPGKGLTVSALLADGTEISTHTSQKLSDFDTRLRAWYGGENTSNANKLISSFSRFNFLNTDAASELTLVGNGVTVKSNLDSLADLVSGPGTSILWKRLHDIQKELVGNKKEFETSRRLRQTELHNIQAELTRLRQGPEHTDADYEILVRQLQRLNWREIPPERGLVDARLPGNLSGVAAQLGAVKRLSSIGTVYTLGAIQERRALLEHCMDEASTALSAQDERERSRKANLHQLSKWELLEKELRGIDLKALKNYLDVVAAHEAVSRELSGIPREMIEAIYRSWPTVEMPDAWQVETLTTVMQLIGDEKAACKLELEQLVEKLASAKRQSTLQMELRAQIRHLAQRLIAHGHSENSCPLCETAFKAGELLSRIQEDIIDNTQEASDELVASKEVIETRLTKLNGQESFFKNLEQFVKVVELGNLSIVEISVRFQDLKARAIRLTSKLEELESQRLVHRNAGIDELSIRSLCAAVGQEFASEPVSVDLVVKVTEFVAVERAKAFDKTLDGALDTLSNDSAAVAAMVLKAGLIGAGVATWMEFISTVREILSTYGILVEVVSGLEKLLAFNSETDLQEVYALLYESISLADSVANAVHHERTASSETLKLIQAEEEKHLQVDDLSHSLDKVTAAIATIADIIKNHSMEDASEQAIVATHTVADEVFARIHAPTEFAITTDVSHPLKRRADDTKLTLNEISTGQRAAYMLSMFLAMNAQVIDGPKVLMLDDPISHIDDLNALSFLDYLRDLVIAGERQIFFATADEKVAGLFAHKFAFLEDEFRTIQLAR